MLAAQAVAEGSLLLQVPEKLMMSANTALKSKHCGKLVRDAELSEWQVCVLGTTVCSDAGDWRLSVWLLEVTDLV